MESPVEADDASAAAFAFPTSWSADGQVGEAWPCRQQASTAVPVVRRVVRAGRRGHWGVNLTSVVAVAAAAAAASSAVWAANNRAVVGGGAGPSKTWAGALRPEKHVGKPKALKPRTETEQNEDRFKFALEECAQAGSWDRAIELMNLMRQRKLSRGRDAWTLTLKACAKAKKSGEAIKLLEEMDKDKTPPDHTSFHAALQACDGPEGAEHANQLMAQMRQRGLMPNLVTYTQVLSTLVRNGAAEEARKMYEEANRNGVLTVWTNRGRFLDLQDLPNEVAEVVLRFAVAERAESSVMGKAGKGGFYILTGPAKKTEASKQQAMLVILKEEFGMKVRVDPASHGRIQIRGTELQRVGIERSIDDKETVDGRGIPRPPQRKNKRQKAREAADRGYGSSASRVGQWWRQDDHKQHSASYSPGGKSTDEDPDDSFWEGDDKSDETRDDVRRGSYFEGG